MPPQMPPQGPPQQPPQQPEGVAPGGAGGGSPVKKLAEGIHSGLMQFMDLLESSQLDPGLKEQLGAVISAYQEFIQNLVGGGGQAQPQERGPTAGGPGAVPAM